MRTLHAVVIGAQKSATTALYRTLCGHPDVIGLRVQEAVILHQGVEGWDSWLSAYEPEIDRQPDDTLLLAKLATAMHFRDTLTNIRRLNESAKVIAVLRHPVDRLLSLHRYAVQQGLETRPPEVALRADDIERAPNWRLRTYSGGSRYAEAIRIVKEIFPPSQMVFLDYADVHTGSCLPGLQQFLETRPVELELLRANESLAPRSLAFARATSSSSVKKAARAIVPPRWRDNLRGAAQRLNATATPPSQEAISDQLRAELLERHLPDVLAAEAVLGQDLPGWRV